MPRRNTWGAEKLTVNFSQKQWRQDFAEYVRRKKFWDGTTRVTKARLIPNTTDQVEKGIKEFTVYNAFGGEVVIQFQNLYEVLYTNEFDLVKSYLEERISNLSY